MNKVFIINCWLTIIAWCFFLNSFGKIAIAIMAFACFLQIKLGKGFKIKKIIISSLIAFSVLLTIIARTTVIYYFSDIASLMFVMCLDTCICNEYLSLIDDSLLHYSLIIIITSVIFISVIISLLPDSFYSIFTKANLYLLVLFIFLPDSFILINDLLIKHFKISNIRKLHNKKIIINNVIQQQK